MRLHELSWSISQGKRAVVCLRKNDKREENVPKNALWPRLALLMCVPGLRRRPPAVSRIHLVCLAKTVRLVPISHSVPCSNKLSQALVARSSQANAPESSTPTRLVCVCQVGWKDRRVYAVLMVAACQYDRG